MSSLADLPELIGFFSYSREDDEDSRGRLSALRDAIQRELGAQLGRSKKTFRLWQDREAIAPGKLWESEIKTAVEQSVFFVPIVTPRAVNSKYCYFEFESFLACERTLERTDLVFPILYITVPALEGEARWRGDPVLSTIGRRQYVDWRSHRHLDVNTTIVCEAIERYCAKIVGALHRQLVGNATWLVNVGNLYKDGRGVTKNDQEAARLLKSSPQIREAHWHKSISGCSTKVVAVDWQRTIARPPASTSSQQTRATSTHGRY